MSVVIVAACFGIVGSQLPPPQGSQSLTLGYKPSPLRGLDLGLALEGRRIVAQGEALRTLGIQARTLSVGARTLGTNAKPLPPITALAVAPDSKSILAGSQSGIQILTYPDLKPDRTLPTELLNIHDLAFSPDGKSFAVAGGIPGKRGMVELFTWPEGKLLQRLKPHSDLIYAIAWRSDSSAFASASADRTVCLIDAKSGKTTKSFEGHSRGVLCAVFLPNGELLTAGIDESLRLWDLKTGESLRTLANHTKQVNGLAVRPSLRDAPPMIVSVSDDRTVRLWQPTLGRLVRFARLESVPQAVAWTPDGSLILVACKDGHMRTIDPDTMEIVGDQPAIDGVAYCLAVSGDGSVLIGGQNGQIKRIALKK